MPDALRGSWLLACPTCRAALKVDGDCATCSGCGAAYPRQDGIWRCLAPERAQAFARFEHEYHTVRRAEGWGAETSDYYRALPYRDLSARFPALWRIRARNFSALLKRVLKDQPRLSIVDLGAGNGWLSYQLARRGHDVAAVDVQVDARDGLGAHIHYDVRFLPIQAEFDRLPVADSQLDLAVFNGSLHYARDYSASLGEALRVLRPNGRIAIIDTPTYSDPRSGERMVAERQLRFQRSYGFDSEPLRAEQFMTLGKLHRLEAALRVRWEIIMPFHSLAWSVRPWLARLRGHREPAQFPLIVGTRV